MVNLFSFGCHVIDRASTDWTVRVRVRETQKEVRGFLANPHWQYGQLTAVKTGWPPTSTTWPYRRLMCQLIQVTWSIWKVSANHFIVLLDRDQCLISCFLASLGAQENWEWTDIEQQCCDQLTAVKTGDPLTSITWLYRGLRCRPIEVKYFLKLSADKLIVFKWSRAQV